MAESSSHRGQYDYLLLALAHELHGDDFLNDAWEEYIEGSEEALAIDEASEGYTSFIPWAVFDYIPRETADDEAPPNELPIALLADDYLKPEEKQFINAMYEAPYSFWAVDEAEPKKSLKLRDLFTGAQHTVKELQASEGLQKGNVVYTRVISSGPTSIMVGLAPLSFPARYQFHILDIREKLFGPRRKPAPSELHQCEPLFRRIYFRFRSELMHPRMLELQNTDGDTLEFVSLTYDLSCTPQEAFDKLRALNPVEPDEAIFEDALRDENGDLESVTFSWMKKGNKKNRSWDNTVLGNISIESGRLFVELNSVKRSKRIQSEIARRLGDSAVVRDSITESVEQKLAEHEKLVSHEERQRNPHPSVTDTITQTPKPDTTESSLPTACEFHRAAYLLSVEFPIQEREFA